MTTMKNSIHDNANGLDYTLVNDHYLPNLTVAAPTDAGHQGHDHHGAVLQGGYRPPGDSRSGQLRHPDWQGRPHRPGVPHLAGGRHRSAL